MGIWYRLVGFDVLFVSLIDFAIFFIPIYLILCFILGRSDFKRGLYQREGEIAKSYNPAIIEIIQRLDSIQQSLEKDLKDNDREG